MGIDANFLSIPTILFPIHPYIHLPSPMEPSYYPGEYPGFLEGECRAGRVGMVGIGIVVR